MKMMLEFKRGAPSMPRKYNQDYQMYNSPYTRPQPSPFSNPPSTPPTNEIIQLQRHVAGTRHFNGECLQECMSFTKPLKMTMKNQGKLIILFSYLSCIHICYFPCCSTCIFTFDVFCHSYCFG